ncbi:hypothetical protein [Colwellia psychrerythraea]|uniref:Uncharacterized protein n=1 Tax=Colwellia psychrerythraea TaxID=28229 RepID=A0A099KAK3_COLPS|nr:hypothetical protein [Colwellia psychrerythraea]KGJ87749.1 hypothetical protein GAB14E_4427 [Colwellia psychrerythraea]
MPANFLSITTLTCFVFIVTNSITSVAFAHQNEQKKLDKACEAARKIALKPRRSEIFQECRQKFKKSESVCHNEAKAYNGNRINGAPMFYELPACEKAFAFRKKNTE